jgi:MFS family permease
VLCLLSGLFLTKDTNENIENMKKIGEKIKIGKILNNEYELIKKIKLFLPASIISGSTWGIVVSYLPLLLVERTDLSLSLIGIIISIWIGVGTIICIFYGKIYSFFGRRIVVLFAYFTVAVMAFLLTVITHIFLLILIMVLLGISSFLTFPAIFSYVSEITDETIEGKTFAYIFSVQLGGATILLFLSGLTADIWGIWTPFFILGFFSSLTAILFIINLKKIKPISS